MITWYKKSITRDRILNKYFTTLPVSIVSTASASNIYSKKRSRFDHHDSDKAITNKDNNTSCNVLNRPKKICLEYMNEPCQSEQIDSVDEFIPFSLVDNTQDNTPINSTPKKTNSSSTQPKTAEVKVRFYMLNLKTKFGKKYIEIAAYFLA